MIDNGPRPVHSLRPMHNLRPMHSLRPVHSLRPAACPRDPWMPRINRGTLTAILAMLSLLSLSGIASAHWNGFYVGGFVGGAGSTDVTATEPLRLDNNSFWFRPFHNAFNVKPGGSFLGGGTIGYNWQARPSWLLSLEGEYGYLDLTGKSQDPNQVLYAALPNNNLHNNRSLNRVNIGGSYGYAMTGGRIAYVQDRSLFYVKAGAVFTNIESKYSSAKTDNTSSTGLAFLHNHGSNNVTGYGVGGGIEYALPFEGFTNISAKIEYLYIGIDRTQLAYGHCSCDFLWRMTEHFGGVHTAKLGINYMFG